MCTSGGGSFVIQKDWSQLSPVGSSISSPAPVQPHLSVNDRVLGGIRVWFPVQKEGSLSSLSLLEH